MRVLITGSTGLLGSTLLFSAPKKHQLFASYHLNTLVPNVQCTYVQLDIREKKKVEALIKRIKPEVIIHTAALATPDYCDKNQDEAWDVNVKGTKNLLSAAVDNPGFSQFIYITTNGVYDGNHSPYSEKDEPKPIDWYGKTKFESEQLVANSGLPFTIIRLNTMFGWNNPHERQNPVTWLIKILGENKTPVNMVDDMFNSFLYVHSASTSIWKSIQKKHVGETYNIGGKECVSRFDFSRKIAQYFDLPKELIFPVKLSFFKNFVPRPKNTCFRLLKMKKMLGVEPMTLSDALRHMSSHPVLDTHWKHI